MALPQFLCIGAMKSATTTLFQDLILNPQVFEPARKEPANLADPAVLTPAGMAQYQAVFEGARADQVCFECSTRYSKRAQYPDVPRHALQVLGPTLKLLYLVREPLARALSHHRDYYLRGWAGPDVNAALRENAEYLDTSRYAFQLQAWLAVFPPTQIKVIRFDHYIARRRETIREITEFLGLNPCVAQLQETKIYNQSAAKRKLGGVPQRLSATPLYRRGLRPLIPQRARDLLRRWLSRRPTRLPAPPTAATLDFMIERLQADAAELPTLPGCAHLTWDLAAAKAQILADQRRPG